MTIEQARAVQARTGWTRDDIQTWADVANAFGEIFGRAGPDRAVDFVDEDARAEVEMLWRASSELEEEEKRDAKAVRRFLRRHGMKAAQL